MNLFEHLALLALLVLAAGFLSLTEIALAGARKIKLKLLAEAGDERARKVMALQAQSADFFAASQLGLNAIAILGGILGEGALRPFFLEWLSLFYSGPGRDNVAFALSFVFVTTLFVLFSDLMPKRLALIAPEVTAMAVIRPVLFVIRLFRPFSWALNKIANMLFRLFGVDMTREDRITFDEISAVVEAGAQAGVLQKQEQHFIENVFELESRTVTSTMTTRENVVFFDLTEPEESIRQKIANHSLSKFPVCDGVIDRVVGYVDTRDILVRLLSKQAKFQLSELTIPDSLTLVRDARPLPLEQGNLRARHQRIRVRGRRDHAERHHGHRHGPLGQSARGRPADLAARRRLVADRRQHAGGRHEARARPAVAAGGRSL